MAAMAARRVAFHALSSGVKPFDKPRLLPCATAAMAARRAAVPRKTVSIPTLSFLASPPRTQYPSSGVKPLAPSGDSVAISALSAAPYLRKKVISSMPIFRTYYNRLEVIGNRDFSTFRNKNEVADCVKNCKENCKENHKDRVADFLKNLLYNLSPENRLIIKEYFISLSVPAVYSVVLWLVSAGADIVKDTQLSRGTLDDPSTTQLPPQVVEIKEELDGKVLQLLDYVKSQSETDKLKEIIVSLKDEKDIKESQIIILRDKLLEKEAEIDMLKHLLAGRMRQAGVVWFKHFAKNLNNASLLSYYDAPEHSGLIFWYPN